MRLFYRCICCTITFLSFENVQNYTMKREKLKYFVLITADENKTAVTVPLPGLLLQLP